jgi:MGT family glycosyltransferase
VRERFDLEPLPIGPDPCGIALTRRAAAGLVAMPREFDPWPADGPANVTHAGPIFEEAKTPPWQPPWPAEDERPLVVVTMGSTYMHQEEVLTRIAAALGPLQVRVLVLTGHELGAEELELGPEVAVRDFVPHAAVLPRAALVVTHAGIGTLMASFAAGVPTLCLPLGRDQGGNADRVAELGAGASISAEAGEGEIREAAAATMASAEIRAAAARMATAIAAYDTPKLAVETVERT